jgi:UDP-GlcNAc:undecaprenyl-phosphate/decaprenyl-phosphate GlcNAc-1-phosphate transferase
MIWTYLLFSFILIIAEIAYLRVARHYQIIDKPNERSSHFEPVIRGGGVIFGMAVILWYALFTQQYYWFVIGTVAITLISYADDVMTLPATSRFLVHLLAVVTLFHQLDLLTLWPLWFAVLAVIICIGTLNAYNFMDGINGITGIYALVALATFFYLDHSLTDYADNSLMVVMMVAVMIFLYFNFRKKAICFAGDVGSVPLAFVQVFLLLSLITATQRYGWVLMMLVFGVDSVITILYRLRRRENIFKAHRTHLYQYLTNELKIPHLVIAAVYGVVQLIINLALISTGGNVNALIISITMIFLFAYLAARVWALNKIQQQVRV